MRELKQDHPVRPSELDNRVPTHSELVAGGSVALMFASLFVLFFLQAPHSVWAVLLAVAFTMLAGAIALGLLHWDGGRSESTSTKEGTDRYERKAVKIGGLVAGLLGTLMLLAASLTGDSTVGTAGGLLGWSAAMAFATATVLPGWMHRRSSAVRGR